jgi:hypothetical protein
MVTPGELSAIRHKAGIRLLPAAAVRYALRNERGWVIPNLVGLGLGSFFALIPSSDELSRLGFLIVGASHLIALIALLVIPIVNVTWLLEISGRRSRLARQWAFSICLTFCCLWLIFICFVLAFSVFGSSSPA